MSTQRIIFHMARADFLERSRRYSFLIILGLVLILGYAIASGQLILIVGTRYRGVINSAWVGGLMSAYIGSALGLFGFYLVKGSIQRDYETGVGQIMATTPLKRPLYTLGKWLSNFAMLGLMVLILMVAAVVMQLVYREDLVMDWWALLSPFLLLALPYMAFTAALAVLFETIRWLRGGLGNVVYFFLYLMVIIMLSFSVFGTPASMDVIGLSYLEGSMRTAVMAQYPDSTLNFMMSPGGVELQTFHWNGITWTTEIVISRLILFLLSGGLAALSALFFDRFNPSHPLLFRRKKTASTTPEPASITASLSASTAPATGSSAAMKLTPLTYTHSRFRFGDLLLAEIKLILKGQRWWWYIIALGLIVAQFMVPPENIRTLLLLGWAWPFLILGRLGCRENLYDTRQIVFSSPHPIAGQLPATWLAALALTGLMGLGAFMKYAFASEGMHLIGWLNGVFFIPTLALACGVLTGSSKTFEILFVLFIYCLNQGISLFDFAGLVPGSRWYLYAPLGLVLLAAAVFARTRQLNAKRSAR